MSIDWHSTEDRTGRSVDEFRLHRPGIDRAITGAFWAGEGAAPLMLFGHGASGDRYQAPICHLVGRLNDDGFHCLSIDGPVHGLRQIGPGGREAFGEETRRPSFIDDMVEDWRAALGAAMARVEVGAIGYFGLSMGSIFGIPAVAALGNVDVAVLGLLGTTKAGRPFSERLLADARRIDCPVAFLMQLEDELFPRDGYLELFDALSSRDKRLHANPGLHPEVPSEEIDFCYEFLRAGLTGGSPDGANRVVNLVAE